MVSGADPSRNTTDRLPGAAAPVDENGGVSARDLSEIYFRAESCRRVADSQIDPEAVRQLRAMADEFDALATRLRSAAGSLSEPPSS
jgi:hypothetical protein